MACCGSVSFGVSVLASAVDNHRCQRINERKKGQSAIETIYECLTVLSLSKICVVLCIHSMNHCMCVCVCVYAIFIRNLICKARYCGL